MLVDAEDTVFDLVARDVHGGNILGLDVEFGVLPVRSMVAASWQS